MKTGIQAQIAKPVALFRETVHAAFLVHLAPFTVEPGMLVVDPHVEIGRDPDALCVTGLNHLAEQVHLEPRIDPSDFRRVVGKPDITLGKHGDVIHMSFAQGARELRRIEFRAHVINARHGVGVQVDGPPRKLVHGAASGACRRVFGLTGGLTANQHHCHTGAHGKVDRVHRSSPRLKRPV